MPRLRERSEGAAVQQSPYGGPAVAPAVLFSGRQLTKGATDLWDQEQRVVAEALPPIARLGHLAVAHAGERLGALARGGPRDRAHEPGPPRPWNLLQPIQDDAVALFLGRRDAARLETGKTVQGGYLEAAVVAQRGPRLSAWRWRHSCRHARLRPAHSPPAHTRRPRAARGTRAAYPGCWS